jgi:alanine racemase
MSDTGAQQLRRAAWLEIDLDALRHNIAIIRSLAGPAAVAPVVKADAYGHGIRRIAEALVGVADGLCVATLDEAVALRAMLPDARVLLLYPVPRSATAEAVAAGVELTIMSLPDVETVVPVAASDRPPIALQLCVETGLGRGGLAVEDLVRAARVIERDPRLRLAGLWSHLADPAEPDASARQLERFERAVAALRATGIRVPARHLAASGPLFTGAAPPLELVRPGLAVYGLLDEGWPLSPTAAAAARSLRPVMSLKARAVAFSEVAVGEAVGYGGLWRAERRSRVAILPLGYADGYLRASQPMGEALVRGSRVPLVGVISMDALAVDVTDVPGIDAADTFVLLGRQDGQAITAGDLARARNTIAWEVLSSMAARLDRVYYP